MEEIICGCLLDYKDYLNSSFVIKKRKYLELEYNDFIKMNKHIIKGFCFLKIPLIIFLNQKFNLNLNFTNILFKLEYYLMVNYTDYYIIGQVFIKNKYCTKYINERKGSYLYNFYKKSVVSDTISDGPNDLNRRSIFKENPKNLLKDSLDIKMIE